jgi:hypothetical protein
MGRWFFLQWPKEWENTDILNDMTYLEIIPIALAIYLWNAELLFYINLRYSPSKDSRTPMKLVLERDPLEEQVVGISEIDGEIMHQLEHFLMTQFYGQVVLSTMAKRMGEY